LVAGARPRAAEGVARLVAAAPVHERGARPVHVEVADLADADRTAVLAAQLDLVAVDRRARRAVADVAGAVGDEHVQHLGRADAVDDRAAVALGEALADLARERLARGRAQAQPDLRAVRRVRRREHPRIAGRRAE